MFSEPYDAHPPAVVGVITAEQLADVLTEITDALVGDHDPTEFLQLFTTRAASMSHSLWVGVLLADPAGQLRPVTGSQESPAIRELLTLGQVESPWLDCLSTGSPVVNIDLTKGGGRWPLLAPKATSAGVRSITALPLRDDDAAAMGIVALFRGDPHHLTPHDVSLLQALTNLATMALQRNPSTRVTDEHISGVPTSEHAKPTHHREGPDLGAKADLATPSDSDHVADPNLAKPTSPPALLTPAEVAVMFRVDPKTITRWARTGQLTAVRTLGGHRRYRHQEVTRLLTQS